MLTLGNVESVVEPQIFDRGERYYLNGAVEGLREQGPGEYVANVRGTDLYGVRVVLDEDDVIEFACGCPYSKGPICKHVVAVLCALKEGERDTDSDPASDILERLSKEELVAIVRAARNEHADVRRQVEMAQATDMQYADKRFVKGIIRDAIRDASDRYGGISYGDTLDAVQGALEMLEVAERLASGQPEAAATIYEAIIEELAPLVEHADDSDGDIGGTLENAFEGFGELALRVRDQGDEGIRKKILAYALKECTKEKYQGWDWPWNFLSIASDLVSDRPETEALERVLEKVIAGTEPTLSSSETSDWSKKYRQERAAEIRLRIITRLHPEAVESFLKEHMHLYPMRERTIERALAANDTPQALKLAEEGVVQAEREKYPGLVVKFLEYQMRCAVLENDLATAAAIAERLFLTSHRDSFFYYRQIKKYAGNGWNAHLERIIETLAKSSGGDTGKLADVYIEEGRWDALLKLVQRHPAYAHHYGTRLRKRFPKEMGLIYITLACEGMDYPGGRAVYQQKCALLRDAKRLGCEAEVSQVVTEWRSQYERRPALMEELKTV